MDCALSEMNSVQSMCALMTLLFGKHCRKISVHSLNVLAQIKLLDFFLYSSLIHEIAALYFICFAPITYFDFYGDWETRGCTGMIQPQNRCIQKLTYWYFYYISPVFLICLPLLASELNSSVPQSCCPANLSQCSVPERYNKEPFNDSFFFFHSTQYGHGVNGSNNTMVTAQSRL